MAELGHKNKVLSFGLSKDKQAYHWVYTNKFAILPNSKYARQLAQLNLMLVKQWNYSTLD